ncbi:MAG: hypothetical protein WBQ62_08225 [Dehalococcoidales bacterium]
MKNKVAWLVFSLLIVSAMLLASCGSSGNSSTTSSGSSSTTSATTAPDASTLTVTYGSVTRTYSMADMQTFVAQMGYGGSRNQDGSINTTPYYFYQGVALADIIKGPKNSPGVEPDGLTAGQSVQITGADGYSVTFTYDQVMNGNFPTYSLSGSPTTPAATTATVPMIALLYWINGNDLDAATGPFEMGIIYGQTLLTDANYWVKMVYKIDVIPAS